MWLPSDTRSCVLGDQHRRRSSARATLLLVPAVSVAMVGPAPGSVGATQLGRDHRVVGLGTLGGSRAVATEVNVSDGRDVDDGGRGHPCVPLGRQDGDEGSRPALAVRPIGWGSYSIAPPPQVNKRGQVTVNVPGPQGQVETALWEPGKGLRRPGWDHGPRAFLAAPGSAMVELGSVGWFSHATAVNDRGQVVGNSIGSSEYGFAGFVWKATAGFKQLVSGVYGQVSDINNRGQAVGYVHVWDGSTCQFVWDHAAGVRCLPVLSTKAYGSSGDPLVVDTNDRGRIVGTSEDSAGVMHAVLWKPDRRKSAR